MKHFSTAFRLGLLSLSLAALPAAVCAQTTGGVTVGAATAADPSAALDIVSTDKGMLLPRLTEAARTGLASPAPGLIVYQKDGAQPGFWYNAGTAALPRWVRLTGSDGVSYDPSTGLQVGPGTVGASPTGTAVGSDVDPGIYRGFFEDARAQFLLRAVDLTAAGLHAGPITSLTMTVTTKNSNRPYQNFTIQLGHTTATTAGTSFVGGLTTVFNGAFSTVVGANTHVFNTPFVWDGSSNVYVQMCYDNSSSSSDSDYINYANTAYQAYYILRADGTAGCALTSAPDPRQGNRLPVFTFSQPGGPYTLPATNGLPGQVLTQQASGAVTFQDPQWTQAGASLYPTQLTSNVGIGVRPQNHFDVQLQARSGTHPSGLPFYVTGDVGDAFNGFEFRHSNGTQGIGIGYNSLYATGTNPDQPLNLMPRGNAGVGIGTVYPSEKLDVNGNQSLTGTLKLNTADTDKIYLTLLGAAGSKIGHAAGWGVLNYAGPNNGYAGFHSWLTGTNTGYAERMRLEANGFLGLGSSYPVGRLHVVNDGGGGGAADDYVFDEYGSGDQAIYFRKAGGTAAAPTNTPYGELLGRVAFAPRTDGLMRYVEGSMVQSFYAGDGSTNLTDLEFITSGSERMRITEDGKLALGLVNPAGKLHLYGNSTSGFAPASGAAELMFGSGGISRAAAIQGVDDGAYGGGFYFNVHQGAYQGMGFADNWPANVITALSLRPSGYVGVGVTAPVSQLANSADNIIGSDANGVSLGLGNGSINWVNSQGGYAAAFFNNTSSGANNGVAVKVSASTGVALDVSRGATAGTQGTSLLTVQGNGQVGIGTNGPLGRLHLVNDGGGPGAADDYIMDEYGYGDQTLYIRRAGGTAAAPTNLTNGEHIGRISFLGRYAGNMGYNPGTALQVNYRGDGSNNLTDLQLYTSGAERVRINEAGNVGIGSFAPTDRLEVSGATRLVNAGSALRLAGSGTGSHVYQEFYPEGVANGRKAYFGFPSNGSHEVTLVNQYNDGNISITSLGAGALRLATSNTIRLNISSAGDVSIGDLAGTGTRVVTADAGGTLSTSSTASTVLDDLLKMQKGVAVVGANAGSTFKTVTVTFPTAFAAAPNVTCTARNASNVNDTFAVTVRSVSTTQFVVNIQRVDNTTTGWTQNLQLNWIALP